MVEKNKLHLDKSISLPWAAGIMVAVCGFGLNFYSTQKSNVVAIHANKENHTDVVLLIKELNANEKAQDIQFAKIQQILIGVHETIKRIENSRYSGNVR